MCVCVCVCVGVCVDDSILLQTRELNEHLSELMEGLTAKVSQNMC